MAELGHNYNIQNMKLFQELKSSFPNVPDSVVRQFMKQNRNDMKKCMEELAKESEKYSKGRYGIRNEALLSHQMDQLLKLSKELTDGKQEVDGIKENIKSMEKELKKQEIMMKAHAPKLVHVEVKQLETAIDNLRGDCDEMSKKVTHLTAGKVPLGETSINFENYLTNITTTTANNQLSLQVPETISSRDSGAFTNHPSDIPDTRDISGGQDTDTCEAGKWSCSECTFANHPSLDTCEICEMPRINLGTNNQPLPSVGCFCHPQDHSRTCHLDQEHYQDKPARVFSDPKYGDDRKPKQRTVENTKHNTNCPNTSTKKQS